MAGGQQAGAVLHRCGERRQSALRSQRRASEIIALDDNCRQPTMVLGRIGPPAPHQLGGRRSRSDRAWLRTRIRRVGLFGCRGAGVGVDAGASASLPAESQKAVHATRLREELSRLSQGRGPSTPAARWSRGTRLASDQPRHLPRRRLRADRRGGWYPPQMPRPGHHFAGSERSRPGEELLDLVLPSIRKISSDDVVFEGPSTNESATRSPCRSHRSPAQSGAMHRQRSSGDERRRSLSVLSEAEFAPFDLDG